MRGRAARAACPIRAWCHCGFVDTDLAAWTDVPKIAPQDAEERTMQALLAGRP
ncbi:MAG TPA: hypothetical protein VGM60_01450 [Pseudonocardia sp.]|jgi:hypothetical protein|uniref:hypothetical protein n=1 Tax=Pseudonocardia sp. TaxID=60912 RepID=UPI002F41FA70